MSLKLKERKRMRDVQTCSNYRGIQLISQTRGYEVGK